MRKPWLGWLLPIYGEKQHIWGYGGMADAVDLKSIVSLTCGFKSRYPYLKWSYGGIGRLNRLKPYGRNSSEFKSR